MKIRQAKKILLGKKTSRDCYRRMRPSYLREDGTMVFPSWHDIPRIARANERYLRYIKRNNNHDR